MKAKLFSLLLAPVLLTSLSFSSQATMTPYMKSALVEVCQSVKSNKLSHYTSTVKSYRLNKKVIAQHLVCNGDDVITFAEKHHAYRTAANLKKTLGKVQITDIAALNKWSVNY